MYVFVWFHSDPQDWLTLRILPAFAWILLPRFTHMCLLDNLIDLHQAFYTFACLCTLSTTFCCGLFVKFANFSLCSGYVKLYHIRGRHNNTNFRLRISLLRTCNRARNITIDMASRESGHQTTTVQDDICSKASEAVKLWDEGLGTRYRRLSVSFVRLRPY